MERISDGQKFGCQWCISYVRLIGIETMIDIEVCVYGLIVGWMVMGVFPIE
ncbi:hypothetical protein WH47_12692 [Habropoda laboriosa]|uniref:Uncharacterized protein n=1 Tax=Habropoda laboriosa TaxID=597456 RepID=A0A0L7R4X4_9HYME|nr:hypothetical protein WH47_12692 [Habropoda laboriosa]